MIVKQCKKVSTSIHNFVKVFFSHFWTLNNNVMYNMSFLWVQVKWIREKKYVQEEQC